MFGRKSGLEDMIGTMLSEQISKKGKYREDCEFCITVANSPLELGFCSHGCKPRKVTVVLQCPADCEKYKRGWPDVQDTQDS